MEQGSTPSHFLRRRDRSPEVGLAAAPPQVGVLRIGNRDASRHGGRAHELGSKLIALAAKRQEDLQIIRDFVEPRVTIQDLPGHLDPHHGFRRRTEQVHSQGLHRLLEHILAIGQHDHAAFGPFVKTYERLVAPGGAAVRDELRSPPVIHPPGHREIDLLHGMGEPDHVGLLHERPKRGAG
jgi:hypothetical protein